MTNPKINLAIANDFSLDNCPCNREKHEYNPDCPLINKLDMPEEYQPAYRELFHVFAEINRYGSNIRKNQEKY